MRSGVPALLALLALLALSAGISAAECTVGVPMDISAGSTSAQPPRRIAVALGSGSMHGLAHIGVIQEIESRGLKVDVITGTSVGAIVGSLWASGLSGARIEALSRDGGWDSAGRFALSGQGLMSNGSLREQLATAFRGRPIESWPRTFAAVATHLDSGERRVLSRGDAALAVQASSAVPVIFMPVMVAGERLADGALVEPVPVEAARNLGADFVIAVDVAYRPYEEKAQGLAAIAFQTTHILMNALGASQLRTADFGLRLDLHHRYMRCGADSLIEAGREAMREAWPALASHLGRSTPITAR